MAIEQDPELLPHSDLRSPAQHIRPIPRRSMASLDLHPHRLLPRAHLTHRILPLPHPPRWPTEDQITELTRADRAPKSPDPIPSGSG